MDRSSGNFVWDLEKERANIAKHGLDFITAAAAFADSRRKIYVDSKHSEREPRYFCVGAVNKKIVTTRFVYRDGKIRIFGAGYWRKGAKLYEGEKEG